MRLFIALDFLDMKQEFLDIQQKLKNIGIRGSFTKEFHLTLRFLGETDPNDIGLITEKLQSVDFKRFRIVLDKCGTFPNRRNAGVIWLGFDDGSIIKVFELATDINNALALSEDKRFHPHITLARVKHISDNGKLFRFLDSLSSESSIEIRSFSLIRSTLTPDGPVYETLKTFNAS